MKLRKAPTNNNDQPYNVHIIWKKNYIRFNEQIKMQYI